jgi:arabinose-5-phosphate isomerase
VTARKATYVDTARAIERGKRVVALERDALAAVESRLGESFAKAVSLVANARGRVIVSGVGKSGLIGRKIAATLTSTGTPATFLHPTEGLHGDLGIVSTDDVALLLSKSGETSELLPLLEYFTRTGVPVVAITGAPQSSLARHADAALDASVREEACPHDLAPTTSTTAALALGDALAVALLQEKGFQREDFARLHPGGALGKKLMLTVADVMESTDLPVLDASATMRAAVVRLAERRGIAIVTGTGQTVAGVVTAGDLSRLMEKQADALAIPVAEVMTRKPKVARDDELGSAAVHRMEQHGIMALPVVNAAGALVGVVHLHDLMRAGAV